MPAWGSVAGCCPLTGRGKFMRVMRWDGMGGGGRGLGLASRVVFLVLGWLDGHSDGIGDGVYGSCELRGAGWCISDFI